MWWGREGETESGSSSDWEADIVTVHLILLLSPSSQADTCARERGLHHCPHPSHPWPPSARGQPVFI